MTSSTDQDQFLLEEYKRLCKEIESVVAEVRQSERFSLVAIGAIWGYLLGQNSFNISNVSNYRFALWLPFFLCILFFIKNTFQGIHLTHLGDYLSSIERHFLAEGATGLGWEQHIRRERKEKRNFVRDQHGRIFWGAVFLTTSILPLLVIYWKL